MSSLKRIHLNSEKVFYALCAFYVFWLFTVYRRQTGGMDDFDIFFKSGERLLNGENIYGPPHYYNLKYFYSVLFAGIMALSQDAGLNAMKLLWFILNTALFVRVFLLLKTYLSPGFKRFNLLFFALLLLSGKMVLVNYTYNQISVLILWTMLESMHQMESRRVIPAMAILCLGINFKIMPLVLAPLYLFYYPAPVKTMVYGIIFLLLYFLLPALFIGWEYNLSLMGEWWKTLNPVSEIHVMQTYEYGFTDISSMVTKFLSAEPVYLEPQLHIADLSITTLFAITNAIRIMLLALVVYTVAKVKSPLCGIRNSFIASATFMALIPICFPHQREYSFIFMMPFLALFTGLVFQNGKAADKLWYMVLVLLSSMLVWEDFFGKEVLNVFRHYRLITLGMTALLVQGCFLMLRLHRSASVK